MLGPHYLLALALLISPVDSPAPPSSSELFLELRPTLQKLAIRYEILDPREVRYVLARPEDFASDLNMLRRRFQDLSDAPALHDSLRFPDRDTVNELLSFNRAYRQHLGARQPVELANWWKYQAALCETDQLYKIWDAVRDARCEYYYVTVRRQALKKLRDLVGYDGYYHGRLPPCVPLWRFQQID